MWVRARLGKNKKILIVFDTLHHKDWKTDGVVSQKGIEKFLRQFMDEGVSFDDVSAVNLADVFDKPKAADYKFKAEYVSELIETYAFNVIIPVGAGAFEKIAGMKGAAKYFGKVITTDSRPGQKILPCPSPAQAKYDPNITNIIAGVIKKAGVEMEYPELSHEEKLATHYTIIDTLAKFDKFITHFSAPEIDVFAYDCETTGLDFNRDEITTIQFSHKPGYSYLIPCSTKGSYPAAPNPWSEQEWEYILSRLRTLFAEESKLVVGHNKKFDDKFIYYHYAIPLQKGRSFDTMIASFLCDENTPNGLKELTCQLTDMGDYELPLEKFKDAYCKEQKIKKKDFSYGMIPFELLAPYALCDTDATIRLYHHFKEELKKEEQEEPFNIVMRITWLLTRFELNGWPVNEEYGKELQKQLEEESAELEQQLLRHDFIKKAEAILGAAKLAKDNEKRKKKLEALKEPFVFNLGSTNQKRVLFFDVLKLPVVKKTKKNKGDQPATDKEAMSIWMRTQPKYKEFIQTLQHWSEMRKFLSTYVIGILSKAVNGRVHPTYNACGAKTGRTSCRNPNWQNLPARGDERKMKLVKAIKKMVEAPEGQLLLGADLSAIEMVWAAIVSGDKKLIEVFNGDGLIHEAVTMELFDYIDCEPKEIKKKFEFERNSVAKTVQFLSVYGGGADALAKKVNESIIERLEMAKAKGVTLDLKEYTKEDAQAILDRYFEKYSGVNDYIIGMTEFVKRNGYSVSPYGYKRRVPAVNSEDEGLVAQAIRQAINQTIQNPASVSLLLSLCDLQEEIDELELDILLLGSIHDAGYLQTAEAILILARDLLLKHMTAPPIPNCPCPIRAEAEYGKNWAEFTEDFGAALIDPEEDEDDEEDEAA